MQSICTLLPEDRATKVTEARATLSEEPSIGRFYDPPFAHFTLQLAEDYDWPRLEAALTDFTSKEEPFAARTLCFATFGDGKESGILVLPYLDERLRAFQERFWAAVEGTAIGNIRKSDTPGTFMPHVTVKRCGPDHHAAGRAYTRLLENSYAWDFTVDNVSVQHDPGKNSRTHYLRWRFPLGGPPAQPVAAGPSNARILATRDLQDGAKPGIEADVETDDGRRITHLWSAPEIVRLRASLKCSDVHFAGGRCLVENGSIVSVEPNTPTPRVL
jgi:2'-5' RNA ligase